MPVVESHTLTPNAVASIQLAQASTPDVPVIHIKGMRFQVPPGFSVKPGQQVDFVNDDRMPHTVTARNTDAASNSLFDVQVPAGKTASITFTAEMLGDQPFFCEFHPSMRGTITVKADAAEQHRDMLVGDAKPVSPAQPSSLAVGLSAPNVKVASARVRIGA